MKNIHLCLFALIEREAAEFMTEPLLLIRCAISHCRYRRTALRLISQAPNMCAPRLKTICAVLLSLICCSATADGKLSFSPQYKIEAEVVAKGQEIKVTVKVGLQETTNTFTVETEKNCV